MFVLELSRCALCHTETERLEGGGYCPRCFHHWVMPPIPVGAACFGCGDRREEHLRWYQLQNTRAVLCHNCTARLDHSAEDRPTDAQEVALRLRRQRRRSPRLQR